MKKRMRNAVLGVLIMWLSWFFGGTYAAGRTAPARTVPNRARGAIVSASGYRSARLEEIPPAKGGRANASLALPQGWPQWAPRYAIDGSPLTKWAAEGSGDQWLELRLGNPLLAKAPVAAVTISWGASYATEYRIMASPDGEYWKQAGGSNAGVGGVETINFDPPILASALRIEIVKTAGSGVEIVDVGVYGPDGEETPGPASGVIAAASGADRIDLAWKPSGPGAAYYYNIYRGEGREPELDPDHLVETAAGHTFTDYGLKPDRKYFYRVAAESFGGRRSEAAGASASTGPGASFARFKHRGVVEGFYNDPWPHQERLRMIAFMEDIGFNYYIYAPKVEPYHRQWWYRPYPDAELKNFAELAAAGRAHGVMFNYGISPGLDMDYSAERDVAALKEKLKSLHDVGVHAFTICLDDIPRSRQANRDTALAQVKMVNEVYAYLQKLDPEIGLLFTPTVYSRTYSYYLNKNSGRAGYLAALAGLHPSIGILWTGPGEVFSGEIKTEAARELKELWGRPALVWDNYPVNDMMLRNNIFTGPYLGRSADLGGAVGGVFLNPMYLPHASKIALYTAGEYMGREDYDPWKAYERALEFLGGSAAGTNALRTVSDCLLAHPVFPELGLEDVPVYLAMEDFWSTRTNATLHGEAEAKLRRLFADLAGSPLDLAANVADRGLVYELLPVADKLSLYGQAGLKALDCLSERDPEKSALLRREIVALQAKARLNPWKVVDERTSLPRAYVSGKIGSRNALDDFITRAVAELPR